MIDSDLDVGGGVCARYRVCLLRIIYFGYALMPRNVQDFCITGRLWWKPVGESCVDGDKNERRMMGILERRRFVRLRSRG